MPKKEYVKPVFHPHAVAKGFVQAHQQYMAVRAAYQWLQTHIEYHDHPNFEALTHELTVMGTDLRYALIASLDAFLGSESNPPDVQKTLW